MCMAIDEFLMVNAADEEVTCDGYSKGECVVDIPEEVYPRVSSSQFQRYAPAFILEGHTTSAILSLCQTACFGHDQTRTPTECDESQCTRSLLASVGSRSNICCQ